MRRSFPLKVKLLVIQSLVLLHILHACSMYLTVRPPTTSGEREYKSFVDPISDAA